MFDRKLFACWTIASVLVVTLSSCANIKTAAPTATKTDGEPAVAEQKPESEEQAEKSSEKSGAMSASDIENLTIGDIITSEEPNTQTLYDNSRYDFPITVNSRVEGWIDYFTGRGRGHMERYLARSSRYIPMMKETLKKAGLPQDLVYLALIESGFNLRAKSRARAVGPWQFMKATGKRYGLRVDAWIDERRDPIRSTEAAAQYLKDLYLMFESWYLAASAYNAGEYKILRAIEELKTNNYWRICETRAIRRETKDYVPKLIAAAIIARNPQKYGFDSVAYQEPLEFETVTVDFPVHLREVAKLVDAPVDEIEDLNPHLVRSTVPPGITFELRVPTGSRTLVERAMASLRGEIKEDDVPYQHLVRNGETLRSVASRYRVSVKQLANANNLSPKEKLSPGLSLIIPGRAHAQFTAPKRRVSEEPAARRAVVSTAPKASGDEGEFITHTVRRGESLWSISEMYDVTVQQIFRWNNLSKSRILPGKRLKIKSKNGAGTEASTESRNSVPKRAATRPASLRSSKSSKAAKPRAEAQVSKRRG